MRFAEAMALRTDEELVDIVTGPPEDWEPDAVEAAKIEIAKRGLAVEPRDNNENEAEAGAIRPVEHSTAPLSGPGKGFALVFGFVMGLLGVVAAFAIMRSWKKQGREREGVELLKWTAAGAAIGTAAFTALKCN